jgi:hypothetical protein
MESEIPLETLLTRLGRTGVESLVTAGLMEELFS